MLNERTIIAVEPAPSRAVVIAEIDEKKEAPTIGETDSTKQLKREVMTTHGREEVREAKIARQRKV